MERDLGHINWDEYEGWPDKRGLFVWVGTFEYPDCEFHESKQALYVEDADVEPKGTWIEVDEQELLRVMQDTARSAE